MRAKRAEDLLLHLAEKQVLRPLRGHQDDNYGRTFKNSAR